MFEEEKEKVEDFRKKRKVMNILWVVIKLVIAYVLITYLDYGILIVVGYILYALESYKGLQFINTQETDLQLNILQQRINKLEGKE